MPSRVVRDVILSSDSLSRISPEAEFLFWRLLLYADDYGCFDARSSVISAGVFPTRFDIAAEKIDTWLAEICRLEDPPIRLYESGTRPFGYFVNWEKHRGRSRRAKFAKFPVPFPDHPGASGRLPDDPDSSGILLAQPGSPGRDRVTSGNSRDVRGNPPRCKAEGVGRKEEGAGVPLEHNHSKSDEDVESPPAFSASDVGTWILPQLTLRRNATEDERARWHEVIWPEIAAAARSEVDAQGGNLRDLGIKIALARWRTYLRTGSSADDREFGIEAAAEALRASTDAILRRSESHPEIDRKNDLNRTDLAVHRRTM